MVSLEADFDGFERKVILIIFVLLDFSHRRKGTWIRKESMKKFEFTKKEDENLIRAPFLYSGSWVVMNSPSLSHDRQVLMDFLFLSSFES